RQNRRAVRAFCVRSNAEQIRPSKSSPLDLLSSVQLRKGGERVSPPSNLSHEGRTRKGSLFRQAHALRAHSRSMAYGPGSHCLGLDTRARSVFRSGSRRTENDCSAPPPSPRTTDRGLRTKESLF